MTKMKFLLNKNKTAGRWAFNPRILFSPFSPWSNLTPHRWRFKKASKTDGGCTFNPRIISHRWRFKKARNIVMKMILSSLML